MNPVSQLSHTGCFIACLAMLLGKSYREAFKLVHPRKNMDTMYSHGFRTNFVEAKVHELLGGLGIQSHTGKYRQFKSYTDRVKKNAIMVVRWKHDPRSCHCIMFDAKEKRFIDPSGGYVVSSERELRSLQRQLDCPIVIDKIPQHLKAPSDIRRDAPAYRAERRDNYLRQNSLDTNEQMAILQASLWGLGAEGTTFTS